MNETCCCVIHYPLRTASASMTRNSPDPLRRSTGYGIDRPGRRGDCAGVVSFQSPPDVYAVSRGSAWRFFIVVDFGFDRLTPRPMEPCSSGRRPPEAQPDARRRARRGVSPGEIPRKRLLTGAEFPR